MKNYIISVLPWIIMAIGIVVFAVKYLKKVANKNEIVVNYIIKGMSIGTFVGMLLGFLDVIPLWTGICLGMLIGIVSGIGISVIWISFLYV